MPLHSYHAYSSPILATDPYLPPRTSTRLSADTSVVVSPTGIIHVLGYTPTEGESGAPISVRIHFHPDVTEEIFVRLVIGDKAIATTVREIEDASYGRWQLDAVAPPFDHSSTISTKVLISVQALNKDSTVLDTVTFGEFSYWAPGISPSHYNHDSQKKPKLQVCTSSYLSRSLPQTSPFRRRGISHLSTPSPISPIHCNSPSTMNKKEVQLHRRTKLEMAAQPKGIKNRDLHVQTPILDLVTPLQEICLDWTPAESAISRRLVRFSKVHDGRRLIVSCEPIKAEDYHDSDSVISCIYREASDSYYVTSVDIIFLLERLTNSDFPVEEKNRIRRNLEGLRPTTVSKHKHGFEDFFQRIMEFPDPKPRNIEKDLKVFDWSLLDQALDKILSKYTIDASAMPVELDSSSAEQSPCSGSEDTGHRSPSRIKLEDTYVDSSPLPTPLQDDFIYLTSSDGSESLCSPLDLPNSVTAYQLYDPETSGASTTSHWGDFKTTLDAVALDPFAAYEVTQQGTSIINYPEVDYTTHYDTLAYQNCIPGEPWN